jgi:predicted metal-dependent enzyme (double-stranded beta helix superfamily)
MSYSLENFCMDARAILAAHDDHDGREKIRQKLEVLLGDEDFRATFLDGDDASGVRQIHEDPERHFCVLVYNMKSPRKSPPHDHGDSWAVYGQADGYTDMTIWSSQDGSVEPVRSFRLDPGQAGLFDVREIHSIEYGEKAKFVRVTGVDLSRESRRVYDPETGAVREIESVGAGSAG